MVLQFNIDPHNGNSQRRYTCSQTRQKIALTRPPPIAAPNSSHVKQYDNLFSDNLPAPKPTPLAAGVAIYIALISQG